MGTEMTIRSAALEDAATLTTIALEAKRYWGYPEHWIKHWESDLTISSGYIHDNHVYVAEENGEIRGFYALVCVTGNKAELDHMWVRPEAIGTGIGKELFLHAMERAAQLKIDAVEISSDPNAAGFYKRMGATQIGEVDSPVDGQDRKLPRLKIKPA
jgi:N-acetylglutamate synthase-like GNAT family acetyltransferase